MPNSSAVQSRKAHVAVLVILAVAAWVFRYGPWLFFSDTATYVQGAQGLAEGNGYRMVAYEHEPPIGLSPPRIGNTYFRLALIFFPVCENGLFAPKIGLTVR